MKKVCKKVKFITKKYNIKGQGHVCPINTRVINHHIYTHTYTPEYTCCEENEKCDVYQGNCNNF